MDGKTNVIVTDGFSGNIALKTAEGTAKFITDSLKTSLTENSYSVSLIPSKKKRPRFKSPSVMKAPVMVKPSLIHLSPLIPPSWARVSKIYIHPSK